MPELCVFAAAQAKDEADLKARMGQALWLLLPPCLLGALVLLSIAQLKEASTADETMLSELLTACAAGFPFLLLGNAYGGVLQGVGRLREMNYAHGVSGLLELTAVFAAIAGGWSLEGVQWCRTAGQALRCALFVLALARAGLPLPRLARPRAAELRSLLRYALGYSSTKILGTAIWRANVPLARAYTTTAVLGAYDAVDRLGTVLQRSSNPVWDSLFQRFVRAYRTDASSAERARGARDFLAGTSLLIALSACGTLAVLLLAPSLFPLWLGDELARKPMEFAPWVLSAWSLNVITSMCTAVLFARSRFRVGSVVHTAAFATQLLAFFTIGPEHGTLSLLLAPLLANAVLAVGLALSGCDAAEVPVRRFVLRALELWSPALLLLTLARFLPLPRTASFSAIVAVVGCALTLAALWRSREVRSLARDFRSGQEP